jgi:hypothetical protein
MHFFRVVRTAVCIAGFAAISAVYFVSPSLAASVCARGGSECQATGKPEPKSLAFVVRYVDRRPTGEFVLTFDNGEVWEQTERNKVLKIERGEQVVIRRATTGKFTLWSRSGESTHVERKH